MLPRSNVQVKNMRIVSAVLPRGLKRQIRGFVKRSFHFKEEREFLQDFLSVQKANEKLIPKFNLEPKHIKSLRVLTDREELLQILPRACVVAELGVNKGEFSRRILEVTEPAKLHLIDAWGNPERYHDGLREMVKEKFSEEIKSGRVEVNVGYSTEVLKQLPDQYFDWVYLDTDHSYTVTAAELALLKYKVKPGGIIAGHDYSTGNWAGNVRYGVIEAVHELCVKDDWELLYTTINVAENPSFAIRKIG